jgi:hypothetical protein
MNTSGIAPVIAPSHSREFGHQSKEWNLNPFNKGGPMKFAPLLCGLTLLATLSFSQQQSQPPPAMPPYTTPPTFPESQQMPPDQKAPPPVALSSGRVEHEIQRHFRSEPELANSDLTVKADDTSVVLTGTVESDVQHALALRIAQSYAGDRKVVDKIQVRQQT